MIESPGVDFTLGLGQYILYEFRGLSDLADPPGVRDNYKFAQWFERNGIKCHPKDE